MSAFMQPEYYEGKFWQIECDEGTMYLPADYFSRDEVEETFTGVEEIEEIEGIGVRLSAPGYLDCTDWAVFQDVSAARAYLVETYDVDPETGEDLDEED